MHKKIIKDLVQEGMAARASYQIWFTLRQEAFPDYEETIGHRDYYDFFDASSKAHFKVIIISLSKIFDSSAQASSIKNLKKALKKINRKDLKSYIEAELNDQEKIWGKITKIRNKSTAHNEKNLSTDEVYKMNAITPNEICCLVEKTCDVINHLASEYDINSIFKSARVKQSTLNMLSTLKGAQNF